MNASLSKKCISEVFRFLDTFHNTLIFTMNKHFYLHNIAILRNYLFNTIAQVKGAMLILRMINHLLLHRTMNTSVHITFYSIYNLHRWIFLINLEGHCVLCSSAVYTF